MMQTRAFDVRVFTERFLMSYALNSSQKVPITFDLAEVSVSLSKNPLWNSSYSIATATEDSHCKHKL